MKKFFLDLFFPIHCLGCGCEGQFICLDCFNQMPLNKKPLFRFGRESALNGLIIASHYEHPIIKQAIHRYKYDFVKDLAKPLGQLMALAIAKQSQKTFTDSDNTILIPVPLHKKRLRWRGFNQAFLLTEQISQKLEIPIPINKDILMRKKYSLPQVQIKNAKERKENIKESFCINPDFKDNLENKKIILIDDICTTGATLEECALALQPFKPKQIWGLVLARG